MKRSIEVHDSTGRLMGHLTTEDYTRLPRIIRLLDKVFEAEFDDFCTLANYRQVEAPDLLMQFTVRK